MALLVLLAGCGRGSGGPVGGPVVVERTALPAASPSPLASPSAPPSPSAKGPLSPATETAEPLSLPEVDAEGVEVRRQGRDTVYSIPGDILFDFDSHRIRSEGTGALGQVAASIRRRYPREELRIEGHTDAIGQPKYNHDLSVRRAGAVQAWLAEHGGIARERMEAKGYGEMRPVAPNRWPDGTDDPIGRRLNRRVEVVVVR